MRDTLLTTRVTAEVSEQLEWLATSTNRSKSWLVQDAINAYLDLNRWQVQGIQEGIKSYQKGEWIEHEKISEWLNSWGSE